MKALKNQLKIWSKEHIRAQEELMRLEELLIGYLLQEAREPKSIIRDNTIKHLETERDNLLREEEENWRLRSRVVCLKSGDKNIFFFHNFASYRRNKKHICDISDEEGHAHTGVETIKSEAIKLFKSFYRKSDEESIEDHVNTARLFGRLVNAEDT